MNLVQAGILNNVEFFLKELNKCSDITKAKEIAHQMVDSFKVSDAKKRKIKYNLNSKRSLTAVLSYAYNMTLSAEGNKI